MFRKFKTFCEQEWIQQQLNVTDFPHQNNVIKCKNRYIMERTRYLALDSRTFTYLWTYAINTATYLINITFGRVNNGQIPKELYIREHPNVNHIWIYNCLSYVHIPKSQIKKLKFKSIKFFIQRLKTTWWFYHLTKKKKTIKDMFNKILFGL